MILLMIWGKFCTNFSKKRRVKITNMAVSMEIKEEDFLPCSPASRQREGNPKLFPYFLGYVIGFMGVANILAFFLERYPAPSI